MAQSTENMLLNWGRLCRCIALLVSTLLSGSVQAQEMELVEVATGLNAPLYVTQAPGDASRLFILEQNSAQILIRHAQGGPLDVFLDLSALVLSGGERGLLGLAFDPDYASNGHFFVNYTDINGDTVVARYSVSADPDIGDPQSALIILQIAQPFPNHNGGMLAFGPDGMLYIGTGDGGSSGDPGNRAQNGLELLGKLLRIDVSNAQPGVPYDIPVDNPFVSDPGFRDEIWALGLRNPWRFSFDRETGDVYIGDVGQSEWEEVDFQAAASAGGENYGWRLKEGNHCFNPPTSCDPGGLTDPIIEYAHTPFLVLPRRCSVTGGYVYRGAAMPLLRGTYFLSDFCSSEIFGAVYDGVSLISVENFSEFLNPTGGVTSFGEDATGEMYVVAGTRVYLITTTLALSAGPLIAGQPVTMDISGANPGQTVFVASSFTGTGRTPVPLLAVDLALDSPQLLSSAVADAAGNAQITLTVPVGSAGTGVWLQAAVYGNTSNVTMDTVAAGIFP